MYVIVEINGQQFKAEEGKKLFVHHIQNVEGGAVVEFDKVLLVDNNGDVKVGLPTVEGAKVVCEVLSPRTEKADRAKKMPIYARFGISYLWLINPAEEILEVFRLDSGRWVLFYVYSGNDKVRAEPFQETEIDLQNLWSETEE